MGVDVGVGVFMYELYVNWLEPGPGLFIHTHIHTRAHTHTHTHTNTHTHMCVLQQNDNTLTPRLCHPPPDHKSPNRIPFFLNGVCVT